MKKKMRETDVDRLARMVAEGFSENRNQFSLLTKEVLRLGDAVNDVRTTLKTHQQMLMDHEHRLEVLEI